MRLLRLSLALTSSVFILLVGLVLYANSDSIYEWQASLYSVISGFTLVFLVWAHNPRLSNWFLWFALFFFLLYQFGSLVGLIFLGTDYSVLDLATTFASSVSASSRVDSYIVSGIGASVFSVLYHLAPPNPSRGLPGHSSDFYSWGVVLVLLSAPVLLVHYVWMAQTFGGTSFFRRYSADAKLIASPVPLPSLWSNVSLLGFALWFASVPPERKFWRIGGIYLLLAFVASLSGARILLILPLVFILWYRAYVYGKDKLGVGSKIFVGFSALLFIFVMQSLRSDEAGQLADFLPFLIHSVSRGQYHLALFLDNLHSLNSPIPFWLANPLFPVTYLIHGSVAVGQSLDAAAVRFDLTHVMPMTLNMDAYVAGAGLGSSLMSESMQYGLGVMFLLLTVHYFSYRLFFNHLRIRMVLLITPQVFMHVVFSPRDSIFPNTWAALKIWLGAALLYLLLKLLRDSIGTVGKKFSRPAG